MRKWTSGIPVLAACTLSAAVYTKLPSEARPDFSSLLPFHSVPGGAVPRVVVALLIPTVALAVWLLLAFLVKVRGPVKGIPEWWLNEKAGAAAISRFEPTYETILFSLTSLIALMHLVFVAAAMGWPRAIFQLATTVLGLGFIAVGNVMPRVRPNWIVGLRTKRTLSDPSAWASTHRLLGALMIAAGALVIVLSVIAPRHALAAGFIALLATFVIAHLFGTRAHDSENLSVS